MYSNDIAQINTGLVNYIGASLTALQSNPAYTDGKYPSKAVVEMLCKEAAKLAQLKDKAPLDTYIMLPMIKTVRLFLEQQQYIFGRKSPKENKDKIIELQDAIDTLFKYEKTGSI